MHLWCARHTFIMLIYASVSIMKHATAQTYGTITSDPATVVVGGTIDLAVVVNGDNTGLFRCIVKDNIIVQTIFVTTDAIGISGNTKPETKYKDKATLTADRGSGVTTLKLQFEDVALADNGLKFKFDKSSGTASDDFPLQVEVCPEIGNTVVNASTGTECNATNYNTFNCATTFACAEGYTGDRVTRTCQNNAVWGGEDIVCTKITTIAPTTVPEATTDTTTTTTTGSNVGAIVGGVIGGVIGLALLVAGVIYLIKKK